MVSHPGCSHDIQIRVALVRYPGRGRPRITLDYISESIGVDCDCRPEVTTLNMAPDVAAVMADQLQRAVIVANTEVGHPS